MASLRASTGLWFPSPKADLWASRHRCNECRNNVFMMSSQAFPSTEQALWIVVQRVGMMSTATPQPPQKKGEEEEEDEEQGEPFEFDDSAEENVSEDAATAAKTSTCSVAAEATTEKDES
ncbi:hypothetical protein NHX12_029820 [Muraenolepis orangiensis]|uniref:Uncharacterized protein n=1 Tax=Muraenolepis orangiensis TaxID=630683 RepID=A0A9Q0EAX2_9TELE|nr:hypothetical protein NHX12_029820 [Muraenolepis orangiensis]